MAIKEPIYKLVEKNGTLYVAHPLDSNSFSTIGNNELTEAYADKLNEAYYLGFEAGAKSVINNPDMIVINTKPPIIRGTRD